MHLKNLLITSVLFVLIVGCSQQPAPTHVVTTTITIHQYHKQIHQDDGSMAILFWYVFMNPLTSNYYYYSSPTIVTDLGTIPWTSSGKALPEEVEEEISTAQEVEPVQAEQAETASGESIQEETTSEQQDSMTNEGGPAPAESETSSSDSSSSSSDSGGGDGGGGGD